MNARLRFLSALSAALLAGCYHVPVTGRTALNLVDEKEVTKMSLAAFEDMKNHYPVSRDPAQNAQLQRVGERLARVIPYWEMPDADWEFVVFDVPEINAFAMAGGKVGVFSGLFKIIDNDDQLASVLGHEIAHVTAKHVQERLSRELARDTFSTVGMIGLGVGGAGALSVLAVQQAYGVSTGADLAFDRDKEREADHIGLIYMSEAGYDPQEAVKVLEKLEVETGLLPDVPAFLTNHPSNPERIQRLTEEMPAALKKYEESKHQAAPTVIK